MSDEFYKAKGRLAALEQEYEVLESKAEALMTICRELLDPYKELLDLDLEKTFHMVQEFREVQLKAREKKEMIDKIKSDYGWK